MATAGTAAPRRDGNFFSESAKGLYRIDTFDFSIKVAIIAESGANLLEKVAILAESGDRGHRRA